MNTPIRFYVNSLLAFIIAALLCVVLLAWTGLAMAGDSWVTPLIDGPNAMAILVILLWWGASLTLLWKGKDRDQ